MRIIAGSARGRRIQAPAGDLTRPTADRVREALFSILGGYLDGGDVLDLFAGAGALGLESLSRGAGHAVFVDHSARSIQALRANIDALGFTARAEVYRADYCIALERLSSNARQFDLIFIDPPYASGYYHSALEAIFDLELLAPGGRIVVEHSDEVDIGGVPGKYRIADSRRYGNTHLSIVTGEGV